MPRRHFVLLFSNNFIFIFRISNDRSAYKVLVEGHWSHFPNELDFSSSGGKLQRRLEIIPTLLNATMKWFVGDDGWGGIFRLFNNLKFILCIKFIT